jgi:uncharacterized membrane protein
MRARWWAIVLGVSVALNLFFVGWLSARAFQRSEARSMRPEHAMVGERASRRLRQRPRPFEWMSEQERDQLRPRRRELRSARRSVQDALRAEPFDPEKLSQALGELRRQTDAIQASVHDSMLRRAVGMSEEERRRLADLQWEGRDDR